MISIQDLERNRRNRRKAQLLQVIDEIRERVETGEIQEFAVGALTESGSISVYMAVMDEISGIGLFEAAKHSLLSDTTNYGVDDEYDDEDDDEI